ncbi:MULTISPECIES: helix-turn-helix transcriptional regulator [Actinosynnema]|uniref:helix-turn-helix domain-containing protein n=1 Tax=Actinosynnema TaxID=40566 RepID=UPI0020A3A470|nr:helix-turn-helix transcriptional regulator [Actinosynnema pretiosum]MCP2098265.1 Helix-turn-helix domain-containing protein [Actinosynnema pretiosum]
MPKQTQENANSQRRQVGAAMRSYRKEAGMDRESAAALLGIAGPSLTRKESGELHFSRPQIEKLAEAYGVTEKEVDMLVDLAKEGRARTRGRTGEFPMFVPLKARIFMEMERNDADEILAVSGDLIPAYFQTEAYMREVWRRNGQLLTPEHVEELVRVRKSRQRVVTRNNPPTIRAILHEFALLLPVGGPEVMREQLLHLAEMCKLPNVEIQVQPIASGAYPEMEAHFYVLRLPDNAAAELVQVVNAETFYRDGAAVKAYHAAWDRRRIAALDLQGSLEAILRAADSFTTATDR